MRCDDPELGIGPADLIGLIDERAAINLRTRAANERALRRWEAARAKEQAPRRGGAPPKPAGSRPEPRPEIAGARTIEEFARAVKSMLVEAHRRGRIPYQPWTAEVDDAVVRAQAPHYTTKSVLSREQVWRAAAAVAAIERLSWQARAQRRVNDGARYEAMIALAGRKGLRPEETVAVRRSWLELDRARPRIALHNAEVYHPLPDGGRVRAPPPPSRRARRGARRDEQRRGAPRPARLHDVLGAADRPGQLDEVGYDTTRPTQSRETGAFPRGGDFEGLNVASLPSDRLLEIQRALGDELGRRLRTG